MKKISLLDMPEDHTDKVHYCDRNKDYPTNEKKLNHQKSKLTQFASLETLIADVAKILEMPVQELCDWTNEAPIPEGVLKIVLTTAKRLKLNPILDQIAWEWSRESGYQVYIPIDGWIAMIHREPSFQGVAFSQAQETDNGVPIWMECTIYQANLTHPVTVREYYVELKTQHPVWQHMPCRMLRHKTLQQCARLAFGICAPEFEKPIVNKNLTQSSNNQSKLSAKEPKDYLRQMLSK